MRKNYVLKNIVTNKYFTYATTKGWTKDMLKAEIFCEQWIREVSRQTKLGNRDMYLKKNEKFVPVMMIDLTLPLSHY